MFSSFAVTRQDSGPTPSGGLRRLLGTLGRRREPAATGAPTPAADTGRMRLFAEALEALPDAVLIVSADRPTGGAGVRVMASNAAAREALRLPASGDERLVSVLRNPEVLEAADDTLFRGAPHCRAFETGGAQPRYWRVWSRPLPDLADGRYALLVLRDETTSRRHERMRVDFLANASHELRTPLASLTGYIETLAGHAKDDPKARDRFLGIMAAQAQRMARLIDDLLSLSRIELNEHVRPSATCDVGQTARELVDGLTPLLADGSAVELAAPAPGTAVAVGDRDQVLQVVQNLIDNALKYSPRPAVVRVEVTVGAAFDRESATPAAAGLRDAGGGRLTLLSPDRPHEGRYVAVRVSDRGAGIAREHLPRLTERFYRVPGQKSGDVPGTGLGLAIIKHVLNRHRGGLVVESAPGQGTSFTAYLPAADAG